MLEIESKQYFFRFLDYCAELARATVRLESLIVVLPIDSITILSSSPSSSSRVGRVHTCAVASSSSMLMRDIRRCTQVVRSTVDEMPPAADEAFTISSIDISKEGCVALFVRVFVSIGFGSVYHSLISNNNVMLFRRCGTNRSDCVVGRRRQQRTTARRTPIFDRFVRFALLTTTSTMMANHFHLVRWRYVVYVCRTTKMTTTNRSAASLISPPLSSAMPMQVSDKLIQ